VENTGQEKGKKDTCGGGGMAEDEKRR